MSDLTQESIARLDQDVRVREDEAHKHGLISRTMARVLPVALALSAVAAGARPADASETAGSPVNPGEELVISDGLEPDTIAILNHTSIGHGVPGYSGLYTKENGYGGTSTTNVKAAGHVSSNLAAVATGTKGQIGIETGNVAQDQIVDLALELPVTDATDFFPTPQRTVDTRKSSPRYNAFDVIEVNYGMEHANEAAFMNITVDLAAGPSWFAAYPCADGYKGTSSVNPDGKGAQPTAEVALIDRNGKVCIIGNVDAAGVIVDTSGFLKDTSIHAPERIVDTRKNKDILVRGHEHYIQFGAEDAGKLAVLKVTAANTVGPGFVSMYPAGMLNPGTSNLNPDGKNATSNLVFVRIGEGGQVAVLLGGSETSALIVDEIGVLDPAELGLDVEDVTPPVRLADTREDRPAPVVESNIEIGSYSGPNPILAEQIKLECEYKTYQGSSYISKMHVITFSGLAPDTSPNDPFAFDGDIVSTSYDILESAGWAEMNTTGQQRTNSAGVIRFESTNGESVLEVATTTKIRNMVIERTSPAGVKSTTVVASATVPCVFKGQVTSQG